MHDAMNIAFTNNCVLVIRNLSQHKRNVTTPEHEDAIASLQTARTNTNVAFIIRSEASPEVAPLPQSEAVL